MEKTDKNSDLINRYIFDVIRRLPAAKRSDIEKELRSLIDDMLSDKTSGTLPTQQDIGAVLIDLGRPAELASKYTQSKRYLIGPDYFDIYILVLKIVLAATVFGTIIAQIIGFTVNHPQNIGGTFAVFIATVLSALVQAFAFVTIVFVLLERFIFKNKGLKGQWKPDDLPPVPAKNIIIKRSEPIVGIVFVIVVIIIFNTAPWLMGAFAGKTAIPIFNLTTLKSMLPLINVMLCLGILKEIFRLVSGHYSVRLAIAVTALNISALILFICIFAPPAIWNANFMTSLHTCYGIKWAASSTAASLWYAAPKVLTVLVIFGFVIDTATTIIRAFRYKI
ncbi:MAG: hypothetical protein ACOX8Q_02575 [Christensenellales bacterium]|jgi:hypothetical protein